MAGDIYTPLGMIERLVAFDTTSRGSNLALIDFVADYLAGHGVESTKVFDDSGAKANLFATLGDGADGIVLSGHTDVVPVDGQDWSSDPFTVTRRDGRLYGRGTADMKSFSAVALALVPEFLARGLAIPVHFALSYDEEVGCLGAPRLIEAIQAAGLAPSVVIVGEPTDMKVVNRHKGVFRFRTTVTGLEAHSAYTDRGVGAIFYAGEVIRFLHGLAGDLAARADGAGAYDPPYHTVHIGTIHGGTASNIIPRHCAFDWEARLIPGGDIARDVTGPLDEFVTNELLPAMRAVSAATGIDTQDIVTVPGLTPEPESPAEALARALSGDNSPPGVVSYGTEAGLFQRSGLSAVVCGPGSILQAHRADEYIELAQIDACIAFMRRLMDHVCRK